MSDFSSPASSSARRNDCASSMIALRSGVTGPSESPTPTTHTRRLCTASTRRLMPVRHRANVPDAGVRPHVRPRMLTPMRLEDMILVSVDDHVVEPPDVFENHLPAKYQDIAPRDRAPRRRHRRVEVPRLRHPERRAQRGHRPPARGVRDGPDELRRAAPGHLRREGARARHVGQRAARLAQLPVAARLRGPALRPALDDKDAALALCPRVQRLAHRRVVRRTRPSASSRSRSRRSGTRRRSPTRCAASRRRAATRSRSPRTRCRSGSRACTPTTGIRSGRRATTRAPIVYMHIGSSGEARDHRARRADRRDDQRCSR